MTNNENDSGHVAPGGEPILRIRDMDVRLAGRDVLHGINLEVRGGELMGLLGPNGAGKTTLLRAVLGLIPRKAGTVEVAAGARVAARVAARGDHPAQTNHAARTNHAAVADPIAQPALNAPMLSGRAARAQIGYVPQRHEFAWDYPISVYNCVLNGQTGKRGLFRRASVADHRAAAEALDRVHLADLADRPIGQLSGGQRQRVLVARALATKPSLLLLDEPFTGMDFPSIELLCDVLAQLHQDQGMSTLMITHDLPQAVHICDRITLLNGSVIATGAPVELNDPEPWTRTFGVRSDSPLLSSLGLQRGVENKENPGNGADVHPAHLNYEGANA
ncbi:anchored repeat-type ABC transporter ATP-binding subunit [Corynebacterium auriscanis]